MHILRLVPDAVGLVDEDEVFVLRVHHLAHIVQVHVLKQNEHLHAVSCMCRSCKGTLSTILHIHVVVIVTVSVALELPAAAILELLRDRMPVPVFGHPVDRWCAISGVHLKDVEARSKTESAHGECFPEADPLDDTTVFVDDLTLLEVERGIWAHRWRLHEGLELVARVSWSSFNTENTLDGLLAKDGVAETRGDVGELLVITPLNLVLVTLVVIIMARSWSVLKSLLVVDFLGLGEPGASGLPPPVVELEVDVVQVVMSRLTMGDLVKLCRDVALLIQVLRSDLCDVHVDHVGVVPINLHHLLLVVAIHINVVIGADVLVRQDDLWLPILVAWSIHVPHLHVACLFLLIHLKEEVLFGHDFVVGALGQFLAVYLVLELNEADLLLDNLVDSLSDVNEVLRATSLAELVESTRNGRSLLECVQVR